MFVGTEPVDGWRVELDEELVLRFEAVGKEYSELNQKIRDEFNRQTGRDI